MKLTIFKEYSIAMHYRDEFDLEIDDEEYSHIKAGTHLDYADLDEWASDQETDEMEPTRRESCSTDVYEGSSGIVA